MDKERNTHHIRSLSDGRKNTQRRRVMKKEKRKVILDNAGIQASEENTRHLLKNMSYMAEEGSPSRAENNSSESLVELPDQFRKLKEENDRLYKHATYFHYRWKKCEISKGKVQQQLPELDRSHLHVDGTVGEGTFGVCYKAKYGSISVAVKEIKGETLTMEIAKEAQILQKLRHPNIPLLLGVCFEKNPFLIVTTYHSVESENPLHSTTMFHALSNNIVGPSLRPNWLAILHELSKAICYIHEQSIIHNDVKTNNVIVERHGNHFSAVLIDFGKATAANNGKIYPEFGTKEQEKYNNKYPYLAPELRSGGGKQNVHTDVYSYGYLLKVVSHTLNDRQLSTLYHSCKNISPEDRPSMYEVENALQKFITQ